MKFKLIALFIIIVGIFSASFFGCGAAPEFTSVDQFKKGQFDQGWLYNMSLEEITKFANSITDQKARELALQIWAEKQQGVVDKKNITIGKIVAVNDYYSKATIGIEGPENKTYHLKKGEIQEDNVIPGEYYIWFETNNQKKTYILDPETGEKYKKTVGYAVEYHNQTPYSSVFRLHPINKSRYQ